MDRRQFLRAMLSGAVLTGSGASALMSHQALASCTLPSVPRTLVNIMLYGGADLRYLFVPSPNDVVGGVYTDAFWNARRSLYTNNPSASYAGTLENPGVFDLEYDEVVDVATGRPFGIHKKCGWLRDQFEAGNVAIIANAFCSRNRRHDQSQLNANVGEPEYADLIYDRNGWGGRLLEHIADASKNVVELSHEISVFCSGSVAGERLKQVIHAQNMRDIALPNVDPNKSATDSRNVTVRALQSYYEARGMEVESEKPSHWPYHLFFQHNAAFREFGDAVQAQLDLCGPLPTPLADLNLHRNHFRQQCWNLYDSCLVADILGQRVLSMRYDGWDTHSNQKGGIENNLEDLFGPAGTGGLATVISELSGLANGANDNLVYTISTDFGRQLAANGARGTDHGRGAFSVVFGEQVNGGVYGELFPQSEITPVNGIIPYEKQGSDVQGLTSVERIYSVICDWMATGSGSLVFPDANASGLEEGVDLMNLLS
jgi:uncharacterized protein (DUF1501 family)